MRSFPCLCGFVCLFALNATAQDPVKVDPKHHKIESENAQVRLLRVNIGPHEKTATHQHPNSVVVFLTDDNNRVTPVGGQPREGKQKRGDVTWLAGEKHVVENMGDKPFEAVLVELKEKPPAADAPLAETSDPVKMDPQHYKVEFENPQVRVLRIHYGAHEKSVMHDHPDSVAVLLGDQSTKFTFPDGKSTTMEGKAGQAMWGAAETHLPENPSDKPFELILVELKGKKPAA